MLEAINDKWFIELDFHLNDFYIWVSAVKPKRINPTGRQKINDYNYIEDYIKLGREFRINIDVIRSVRWGELLTDASEEIWVWISTVIAQRVFSIDPTTICHIQWTGKRPDWQWMTTDNKVIIVESKGTINISTQNSQKKNAFVQLKSHEGGDIKVASLTLINEDEISVNQLIDPPINPWDWNISEKRAELRASHYAVILDQIWENELSKYFTLMKIRVNNWPLVDPSNEKNELFSRIKHSYKKINFLEKTYFWRFTRLDQNNIRFIGIDEQLISYKWFLDYSYLERSIDESIDENEYHLSMDGILIVDVYNPIAFQIEDTSNIPNYQEDMNISDIDILSPISFEKYIYFLISKSFPWDISREYKINSSNRSFVLDLIINWSVWVEIKFFRNRQITLKQIDSLISQSKTYLEHADLRKMIIITNWSMKNSLNIRMLLEKENIVIIDRELLEKIINNNFLLRGYIS